MTTAHEFPTACVFALQLQAFDPAQPERIAGRLEHVLSGRRHAFADGSALLACIAHEQRRAAMVAAHQRGGGQPVEP